MIGIGIQPAGVTLGGLGSPEETTPLPKPESGAPHINISGNYVIAPNGDVARDRSARHRVLLCVRTIRKSATADPKLGISIPQKIGTSFDSEMRKAIDIALTPCTSDGSVRVDDVKIENRGGGRVYVTISFTDLLTMAQDEVVF